MHKLKAYLQLARPHHYLKNGFVWLPLFFGYKLHDNQAFFQTALAFCAFSLAASSVYIVNDLADIREDRQHPAKKNRPLAGGLVGRTEAAVLFFIFLSSSCLISYFLLPLNLLVVIALYVLLNFAYTWVLKKLSIIDVFCIATGFVFRVYAGGIAANVPLSQWIVMMTFLIALFLALAKRRDDLVNPSHPNNIRKSLEGYNREFLSLSMGIMASVIIVSYILYTVSPEIVAKHSTNKMYLTAFWVILGLLRYLQLVFVKNRSESPTKLLLTDFYLQAIIIFWLLTFYLLLYGLNNSR